MIDGQRARFESNNTQELIENYIREPEKYEKEYFEFLQKESVQQYNDYFESEKDEVETQVMSQNQVAFAMAC